MNRKVSLRVRELHAHLTCYLCDGYFVDATTIIECLHSFCRTCIVRYLTDHKSCPICNVQVHKTRPLLNIRSDQTLQDIVYILVPDLRKDEMKRRREFWSDHKMLKDDVAWSHLTPEDLGEADELKTGKSSKKLCLTIEPHKRRTRKLEPDSDWMELDKEMTKRYLRCSHDVTMLHLHKLIRMKFKEPEHIEVLIFCGESIIPQKYTLGDVLESFPCAMNQALELKYGLYVSKTTKRKRPAFWDNVDVARLAKKVSNSNVKKENTKSKKPLSATPQLKAFFNSIKNSAPKTPKLPTKVKSETKPQPSIMDNSQAVENREDHAKIELLSMVQLKTVDKNAQDLLDGDAESKLVTKSDITVENKSPEREIPTKEISANGNQQQNHNNHRNGAAPQPKRSSPGSSRSQEAAVKYSKSANVKCYEMLDIPVAEAVRRKPPTPVEVPDVTPNIVERPSICNVTEGEAEKASEEAVSKLMPFVQRKSPKRDNRDARPSISQSRTNRRKPTNPTQYPGSNSNVPLRQEIGHHLAGGQRTLNSPKRPVSDEYMVLGNSVSPRMNQTPKAGQFILLGQHGNKNDANKRQMPTQQRPQHAIQPLQNGNHTNGIRRIQPHPSNHVRPPQNGRRQGGQNLSNLSNAAAHRVALDAVRNTMGGVKLPIDKKQGQSKRPILPKSTPSFSPLVVTRTDGIPQIPHGGPTRNIFQNEKVTYPMGNATGQTPNQPFTNQNNGASPPNRQPHAVNKHVPSVNPPRSEGAFKPQTSRGSVHPFNTSASSFVSAYQAVNGRGQPGINTPAQQPQQQTLSHQQQRILSSAPGPASNRPFVQAPNSSMVNSRTNLPSHASKRYNRPAQAASHTLNRNENNHHRPTELFNSELLRATIMSHRNQPPAPIPRSGTSYMDQRIDQVLAQGPKPAPVRETSTSLKDPYQQTTIEKTKAFVRSLSQQQNIQPPSSSSVMKAIQTAKRPRMTPHTQNHNQRLNKALPNVRSDPIETAKLISQIKESQRVLQKAPRGGSSSSSNSGSGSGINSRSGAPSPMKRQHSKERPVAKNAPTFAVATPPAGTRSPWASRAYPLPAPDRGSYSESEYQPPIKKSFTHPPKAHQPPQSPIAGSRHSPVTKRPPVSQAHAADMVPLELTSRTRKISQSSTSSISSSAPTPPANPVPACEQPLCLVMKKA